MFKRRLTKFCVSSLLAISVLFVGGSLQSCKDWLDEYPYDNPGDPEWLGPNIYDFLKKGTPNHTYANFVAIIDSLGEKESLAHTGSKTLFVADDAAFEEFFKSERNVWGVTSVADMSKAQMKMILYGSMLDNAMLLDMLSSKGVATEDEGSCLRRWSSSKVIDTIPLLNGGVVDFKHHDAWPTYNKYWNVLRGKDRTEKLRLAMDGSRVMLVQFLGEYLKKNNIKTSDIEFLFTKKGERMKTYVSGDALIYGSKIVSSDVDAGSFSDDTLTITCKNGYVYRMDELLLPPSNMAEELRKHPDTRIFSHMLDRFCIPVYDEQLSKDYNALYKSNDSIFRLRYFTEAFASYAPLAATDNNPENGAHLKFDPGQNDLGADGSMADNMAAMFVPNDEVLYKYFLPDSAGYFLLERFAPDAEVPVKFHDISTQDVDILLSALDNVPEKNIALFLNNLMKPSFSNSVLSKFDRITNSANELMYIEEEDVDECLIANNGVVYVLNQVFGPGEFEAVHAPTFVYDNMQVISNVIKQLRYDYYLLAMEANYSFIIPDDNHFVYYDPLTVLIKDVPVEEMRDDTVALYASSLPTAYWFHYDRNLPNANGNLKFWASTYRFDAKTSEYRIVDTLANKEYNVHEVTNFAKSPAGAEAITHVVNRFTDLMEYLIIVHEDDTISRDRKYYQTKGYGTMKVLFDGNEMKLYGGEQLERGTSVVVTDKFVQKNGIAYSTVPGEEGVLKSAIPTPPTRSVYDNLKRQARTEYGNFYEFFNLCYPCNNYADKDGLLMKVFGVRNDTVKSRYSIFNTTLKKDEYTKNTVPFFNLYHYTVYAPSNQSIREMRDRGLPTWAQVDSVASAGKKAKAAAMLKSILNFAKYHFQDNSVYVETVNGMEAENKYSVALLNEKTKRYYNLTVYRHDNTIKIIDDLGNTRSVLVNGQENKDWNIMCRDNVYKSKNNLEDSPLNEISSSSFSVLHPIDSALLNASMFGYDNRFKRFADNGALVDIMYVDGTGAVNVSDDGVVTTFDEVTETGTGKNYYLVAQFGNINIASVDGVQEIHKAAYLMKRIPENERTSYTHEELLTREVTVGGFVEAQNILITDEGYGVNIEDELDEKNNKVGIKYVYDTVERDGIIYMKKYDNDGNITEVPATDKGGNN